MRALFCLPGAALLLLTAPAAAAVIDVSPSDGMTAYTKIEGAGPGDEVVIAPGTYAFRVYLQGQGTPSQPIYIHAADPSNPPVWDFGTTLVEDAPGSYTAPDKNRGCWQVSGGANYIIEGIVFKDCHSSDFDSAGMRYYNGTTGLELKSCLFESNDNGLTGGTEASDATVEFSEFSENGNLGASSSSPTHNVYIYAGTFAIRYSYLHDPTQGQNLHCRATTSTIEYNWFDRAKSYVGDLMTNDDYANNPSGSLTQSMTLRGNVIIEAPGQANTGQIWAVYNDEASGSPVSFSITALYNTVIGAGAHAAFVHLSNADGTQMTGAVSDNLVYGTSQPVLIEDTTHATLSGTGNWLQTGADATGLTGSVMGTSPGFTSMATDDFTLAAGSACIGAADTSVMGLPVAEYYQNETVTRMYRVRAAAADIGAFEHDTTGPGIGPYGPTDGGVASTDASTPRGDSGSGVDDSGAPQGDASSFGDAGAPANDATGSSSGCGCSVVDDSSGFAGAIAGLYALLAAAARRRGRR